MTLPLWGQLEKAQDDSETIEQAIARLIAEHEADPEAHLGEGESLSAHKNEDVIDHPAGSILPDKWSIQDFDFETNFESLTPFTISAGVDNGTWPGVSFDIFDGGGDTRSLRANLAGIFPTSGASFDYLCDTYFHVDTADSLEIVDIGISNPAMTTRYTGFRITGGNVYGVARWGGAEHLTPSLGNVADNNLHFTRVYYDYGANTLNYYLDGALLATLTPASALEGTNQWSVYAQDNGAEGTVVRLAKMYIARGL